jgi:hypothetical protein
LKGLIFGLECLKVVRIPTFRVELGRIASVKYGQLSGKLTVSDPKLLAN